MNIKMANREIQERVENQMRAFNVQIVEHKVISLHQLIRCYEIVSIFVNFHIDVISRIELEVERLFGRR